MKSCGRLAGLVWAGLLAACSSGNPGQTLPEPIGQPGELVVVCDPALWNGASGRAIRSIYGGAQPGMPQPEPAFRIYQFRSDQISSLSRRYRNLLFLSTTERKREASGLEEDLWGSEQRPQDRDQKQDFIFAEKKEHWAHEQYIMYLVGRNDTELAKALLDRKEPLLQQLNESERSRGMARLKKIPAQKEATEGLRRFMGIDLHIPNTYSIKRLDSGFVWLSRDLADKSYNLLVWTTPVALSDGLAGIRPPEMDVRPILERKDTLTRMFVAGPLEGTYYRTEYLEEPTAIRFVRDNTIQATEIRGLWKIENDFMGGPFVHLSQYDPGGRRIVNLEGFVYYPEESKRELLRELECLIYSAKSISAKGYGR